MSPQRNQREVGEEITYCGSRADLEVKADTESDLPSSTSHFSELCPLGPFMGTECLQAKQGRGRL